MADRIFERLAAGVAAETAAQQERTDPELRKRKAQVGAPPPGRGDTWTLPAAPLPHAAMAAWTHNYTIQSDGFTLTPPGRRRRRRACASCPPA